MVYKKLGGNWKIREAKMDNKNVFVAIALSMSVLLFWAAFFETPRPSNKQSSEQKKKREFAN